MARNIDPTDSVASSLSSYCQDTLLSLSVEAPDVEDEWLDESCTDAHLSLIACYENFHAGRLAQSLDIPYRDYHELKRNTQLNEVDKTKTLLEMWRKSHGSKATYRWLVNAFFKSGSPDLAEKVCKLLKEEHLRQSESECYFLEQLFLNKLREQLSILNRFGSDELEIQKVIIEFIENSFKAGSKVDQLLEHLQSLYDVEKLISSPAVFENSKRLALREDPQLSRTFVTMSPPHSPTMKRSRSPEIDPQLSRTFVTMSPSHSLTMKQSRSPEIDPQLSRTFVTMSPPHSLTIKQSRSPEIDPQLSRTFVTMSPSHSLTMKQSRSPEIDPQLSRTFLTMSPPHSPTMKRSRSPETTLSSQDVYHCSLCCLALTNNQDSFTCTDHCFKKVSISQSHSGKYLVAVGDGGTTLIAFQSEPELRNWPEKYKSFDKGISQQSKEFPISFILELLNKPSRVVLTGFSLGGLLACSIAGLIWKCGLFSARHLQERLSCITFSQPFFHLPELSEVARSHPEIVATLHTVYREGDGYPQLLRRLNVPLSSHRYGRPSTQLFEDTDTVHLLHAFATGDHSHKALAYLMRGVRMDSFDELPLAPFLTYHLLTLSSMSSLSYKEVFGVMYRHERDLLQLATRMPFERGSVESMGRYAELVSRVCQDATIPPVPLNPVVNKVLLSRFGSECVVSVEGTNLHFCNKLSIQDVDLPGKVRSLSGSALQVNLEEESGSLPLPSQSDDSTNVKLHSPFSNYSTAGIEVQNFPMSMRQNQLSKLSPAKVIELSYLSALLEQPSPLFVKAVSPKVDNIRRFLERIVHVVPIESIGYAANCGNKYVAERCREVIEALRLQSVISAGQCNDSDITPADVLCDLGLNSLYPMTSSSKGFHSPIDILNAGREKLICLNRTEESASLSSGTVPVLGNARMLETVNQIKKTDLALCVSLIVSFISQQSNCSIPLLAPGSNHVSRKGLRINTSALASLGLEGVYSMLKDRDERQLLVQVKMDPEKECEDIDPEERNYTRKLYFILQCCTKHAAYSNKCDSYSLERQLFSACQSMQIAESVSLSSLVKEWEQKFHSTALSLIAKPHRPLIARWLKWSLMVHNLREELAKYTAVGVVGLVNSGKSKLVNSLFKIKTVSGTTGEERTTVPFIYNLNDRVDGLDVVDFPGVDDIDESIPDLADLLLSLAQIIIFVVDYRKVRTKSSKKWLDRLQKERVPFLVCLTFADSLFVELMRMGPRKASRYPVVQHMRTTLDKELHSIRDALGLPEEQEIHFCSFYQESGSFLDSAEGREGLRVVGISTPLEVGDWLVDTFRKFELEGMAQRLTKLFSSLQEIGP